MGFSWHGIGASTKDIGADVGEEAASFLMDDRDYFMKDLEQTNRFAERPPSYQRSIRYVLTTVASEDLTRGGHVKALEADPRH